MLMYGSSRRTFPLDASPGCHGRNDVTGQCGQTARGNQGRLCPERGWSRCHKGPLPAPRHGHDCHKVMDITGEPQDPGFSPGWCGWVPWVLARERGLPGVSVCPGVDRSHLAEPHTLRGPQIWALDIIPK